jgi:hypothetical protein
MAKREIATPRRGAPMTRTKLQLEVIGALRSAGATEEIIGLVQSAFGACTKGRPGRPRK